MSDFLTGDGRTHIQSGLMRESLQDRAVMGSTHSDDELQIMPHVTLISIGGQSIFDRGSAAILPVVSELVEARKAGVQMVIGVGGGTRVRHTLSIAADLRLPTGGMAQLVGAMEECNAVFLNALMAEHGSLPMQREHFWDLPLYLNAGLLPIVISVPPYHFWEPPPESGAFPEHGSDFGLFVHAEVLGMKRIIFVKDEDGLYDRDPKKHDDANLIERTTLSELLKEMPEELILDRMLFETWKSARHVKQVQIVNGLKPGMIARALSGEDVGTVITKES